MAWQFNKGGAAGAAQPALAQPAAAPAPAAAPMNAAPPPPVAAPSAPAAAGGLPTFQPGAPAQPPIAQPAATPAKRRTRGAAAAAAPAAQAPIQQVPGQQTIAAAGAPMAAPVAAPAAVAVAVATPAPAASQLPAPQAWGGFLGLIIPATPGKTALSAIVEGETAPGEPNVFPTIYLTGGPTGGMLDVDEMNEEGSDHDLPVGRRAINAVIVGFRLIVVAWPEVFKEGGPKRQPRFQGSVPSHEVIIGDLVQNACQRYTFRNRDMNAQYDPFGHPAPTLELLCFDPKAGLYCTRTTGTYDSMLCTSKALNAAYAAAPGGVMQPIPAVITPVTEPRSSKGGKAWYEHYFDIRLNLADQTLTQAFNAFFQQAGNDPGLNEAVAEWNKTTLEQSHIEALKGVLSLG